AADMGIALGIDDGNAEMPGVDAGEFRNIGRDITTVRARGHLLGDLFHDLIELGQGQDLGQAVGWAASCKSDAGARCLGAARTGSQSSWERGRPRPLLEMLRT